MISGTLLYDQEVSAAVANGYVYFDVLDSLQCHDLETTTITCLKQTDFDKLISRTQSGAVRRAWVLVPHGSLASPRECADHDLWSLRHGFLSLYGPEGIVNVADTND